MTPEEQDRQQDDFNRRADRTARWIGPEGCIPGLLIVLLPLLMVF